MFGPTLVGLATSLFVATPLIRCAMSPMMGGFMAETVDWRSLEGFPAIFTGVLWSLGTAVLPETYALILLQKRAQSLSQTTGKVYKSKLEVKKGLKSLIKVWRTAMGRPWLLLFAVSNGTSPWQLTWQLSMVHFTHSSAYSRFCIRKRAD